MVNRDDGTIDVQATCTQAFANVVWGNDPNPRMTLGIFVHQGAHYTAIINRDGIMYQIDSRPIESGEGRFVYEVSEDLFAQYVQHFINGRLAPGGRRVGGLFKVFYTGVDVLEVVMEE